MKVYIKTLDIDMNISPDETNVLVLEGAPAYRECIQELLVSVESDTDEWILSDNEKILKKSTQAGVITSVFNLECNSRRMQKAVIDELSKIATDEEHYKKTSQLLCEIEQYLYELEWNLDYNINVTCEDFNNIMKQCANGVLISEKLLDRVIEYIKLAARLLKQKLLIFVGAQRFFAQEEWLSIEQTANCEEIILLAIETEVVFDSKYKIVIDKDGCRVV